MKKTTLLLFALVAAFGLGAVNVADDDARQAVYGALDEAVPALAAAPFAGRTVAVLPISGDTSGLVAGRLKNLLTKAGFTCVEGKDEPMWNELVKEIAWDERKDDILDPATLVKFGKLKGIQILLYGNVRVLDRNPDRVYAEIELHATDLATRQHIWGGNFACRFYTGKDVQGIVSLDSQLRMLLKKNFEEAKQSLLSPEYAPKLAGVKTVTVIPLSGDIDRYLSGLAVEMLTQTSHLPKNPQIPSLAQVRSFVRDGQLGSDAIFYGAVRDLSRKLKSEKAEGGNKVSTYALETDIQLFLEDAKTGNVLWSRTITLSDEQTEKRQLTAEERKAGRELKKQLRQEKLEDVPEQFKEDLADNWKGYLTWIGIAVGGIILLVILIAAIKGILSNFFVR